MNEDNSLNCLCKGRSCWWLSFQTLVLLGRGHLRQKKTTNKIHEDGADAALNRQLKHAFIKLKQDPP